jgi:hypothetical protein
LGAGLQALGIVIILGFGAWFRYDNRRRDNAQGFVLRPKDVATQTLTEGLDDPNWRWTS